MEAAILSGVATTLSPVSVQQDMRLFSANTQQVTIAKMATASIRPF